MTSTTSSRNLGRLGMTLIFLAVLGMVSYRSSNQFVETGSQVARSYQVLEKLQSVQLLLQEDESAQRGFLLTGDQAFLKPIPEIRKKLVTGLETYTSNLMCTARDREFSGVYKNTRAGLLRFSLTYDDADGSALQMVVTAPDEQTYLWKDSWNLDVPEAMTGDWRYTITVLRAPEKFPFKLTIKHLTVPEALAKLIETEGNLTLRDDVQKLNTNKSELAEELRELVIERDRYSDDLLAAAAVSLKSGRAIFDDGKGQELLRRIDAKVEEIRAIEEKSLRQHLVEVRHSAEVLGETVVGIHFVFMAVVVFGQILVLIGGACGWRWVRNLWFRLVHLSMILIVVVESIFAIKCPLTVWEKDLKLAADMKAEEGGFIARWMHKLIIFDWADPTKDEWMFEIAYISFGALVLASFWLVPPCRRKKAVCQNAPAPVPARNP